MTSRQYRALQRISNVLLLTAAGGRVDHPRIQMLRTDLEKSYRRITRMAGGQVHAKGARGATGHATRRALDVLRTRHMIPLATEARALLRGLPGLEDALRIPHKMAPLDEQLRAAQRIGETLAPYAREFLKRQYRPDFLDQLARAATDLEHASADPGGDRARLSFVTRGLREELSNASSLIHRMDAVVCAEFYDDRELIAAWRRESRMPARQGRPPKKRVKPAPASR